MGFENLPKLSDRGMSPGLHAKLTRAIAVAERLGSPVWVSEVRHVDNALPECPPPAPARGQNLEVHQYAVAWPGWAAETYVLQPPLDALLCPVCRQVLQNRDIRRLVHPGMELPPVRGD